MLRKEHRQVISDYLMMTAAIVLTAVGVYFFKFPNHFSTGGVTGIAIVLEQFIPGVSVTLLSNIMNLALLVIGLLLIGRDFGLRTTYCTLLLTALLAGFERWIPLSAPLTDQPFLELMFAMLLPAVGAAMLFHVGASSGGTDIVAMLLKKYANVYNIGTALFLADFLAAMAAFWVFDIKIGLYSIFGLLIRGVILDGALKSLNERKYFHIITSTPQPIRDFITGKLNRSATLFEGAGAYTGEPRTLLITVVSPRQAGELRSFVRQHYPQSFLLVTDTSDIIGNGFRNMM